MRAFSASAITLAAAASTAYAWQDATEGLTPYTIYAYGINATFIGFGARLTSLYVHDKDNTPRDVVVGYDDPAQYIIDNAQNRTFFGAVVGRYANRIKNGTFEIDNVESHIPENEHNGADTLHGGYIGYDNRNWTVTAQNTSSITFSLYDDAGTSGFPGAVLTHATYTVLANPTRWVSRLVSVPLGETTPIMLANHIYWNFNAFSVPTVLNDTLWMPYAARSIDTDSLQVPTGGLSSLVYPHQDPPVPLNFTGPKQVYEGALYSQQCGTGCTGIDNAFIIDRPSYMASDDYSTAQIIYEGSDSGIIMTLQTNQDALQVYSCVGQNGSIGNKKSQQGNGVTTVNKFGCIVFETEQWIDGINHPEWGQNDKQFFSSATPPSVNYQIYTFTNTAQD